MIAALLTGVAGITGAGALAGIPYIGPILSLLGTRAGKFGMIALGLGALYLFAHHNGAAEERGQCQTAALRSELQATQIDLSVASDRAKRQAAVLDRLGAGDVDDQETINRLAALLAKSKLQSTEQGAKKDATAILDDHCALTARGADPRMRRNKSGP